MTEEQVSVEEKSTETKVPKKFNKQIIFNVILTAQYYYTYICLGILVASLGWSNLQLQRNTNSTVQNIGFLFTARGVTWVVGTLLGGKFLDYITAPTFKYSHIVHPHFVYTTILSVLVLMYTAIPIITNYYLLLILHVAYGFFAGMLDLFPNVLIMWIWKEKSGPFIQLLHAFYGIGAFVSPFIAGLIMEKGNLLRFYWAFWINSILVLICIICFMFLPIPDLSRNEEKKPQNIEEDEEEKKEKTFSFSTLISKQNQMSIVIALLLGFYVGGEVAYGGLLANYVVGQGIGTEKMAAYLTSAFWLSFTVGRVLSAFISIFLDPRFYITTSFSISIIGLALILIFSNSIVVLWISTLLVGFFYGPIYAIALSYPSSTLKMEATGAMTSIMQGGAVLGEVLIPAVISNLFFFVGPVSFVIVQLFVIGFSFLLFVALIIFFRKSTFEIPVDPEKDEKKAQFIDENEEFELKVEVNDKTIIHDHLENSKDEELKDVNLE
eukprot:gene2376-2841_t